MPGTPAILRGMYRNLDMSNKKDLATWCSYLVTFYCLFRKSNTVPKSASKVNLQRTLLRKHIRIDEGSNRIFVHVTFSKTIQFGDKDIIIPVPGNSDPALDPVRHLKALFDTVQCSSDSPAFSFSENQFITYSGFTTTLKKLLSKAGYDPSLYSGHSFRMGGATFLFKVGASVLQIQASGDWASQCFVRYLYISEEERLEVQKLMSSAISSGHLCTSSPLQTSSTHCYTLCDSNPTPSSTTGLFGRLGVPCYIYENTAMSQACCFYSHLSQPCLATHLSLVQL